LLPAKREKHEIIEPSGLYLAFIAYLAGKFVLSSVRKLNKLNLFCRRLANFTAKFESLRREALPANS
jgi:hypothetical protein